jgi:hypothetical protein
VARVQQACDGCGQSDDHPKLHYGGAETYHHDCIPYRVLRDLTTVGTFIDGQYVETPGVEMHEDAAAEVARLVNIVDACKGGLKGDDLLAYIQEEEV